MSTKDELLKVFEENKGEYLSGEEIADRLEISRTAVWKAVNSLREDGYPIDAVKTKGYCLSQASDIVSAQGVGKYLTQDLDVVVYDEVDSTNTLLKKMASEGAREGTVVIANSQTGGKGRLGRKFFSPLNTGVYISVLLRPEDIEPQKALKITTMAAVAAAETIDEVSGKTALIKWVNDVFVDGLKCVGILTEASISMESGNLEYAVLGIGFNVYLPEGGSLKRSKALRERYLMRLFRMPRTRSRQGSSTDSWRSTGVRISWITLRHIKKRALSWARRSTSYRRSKRAWQRCSI